MNDLIQSYLLPLAGYRSRKAAQICAYFALRSSAPKKGMIEKLKLIKLIYFSEREFIKEHHFPMLLDELYSLPHGPICSATLNGINGDMQNDVWSEYIARNGNVVVSMKNFSREDMDELSNVEIKTLKSIWHDLGGMTASQLRNYSHSHCSEYTEIESGRIPIAYREIARAVGATKDECEQIENEISEIRRTNSILFV